MGKQNSTCFHNVLTEEDDRGDMADYFYSSIVAPEIERRRNDLNDSLHTKTSSPILYDYSISCAHHLTSGNSNRNGSRHPLVKIRHLAWRQATRIPRKAWVPPRTQVSAFFHTWSAHFGTVNRLIHQIKK